MSKILLCAFFFFSLFFSINCGEKKRKFTDQELNDINPNKSSELAILMRKMQNHFEELKKNNLSDLSMIDFPRDFSKIKTAIPTDSTVIGEVFNGYSDNYLKQLKTLYIDSLTPPKEHYHKIVKSCISCHEYFCPGPIKRIKKLYL